MLCSAVLRFALLCCAVLRFAVRGLLGCVVLWCTLLWCALLCCAVLCCVLLSCVVFVVLLCGVLYSQVECSAASWQLYSVFGLYEGAVPDRDCYLRRLSLITDLTALHAIITRLLINWCTQEAAYN